MCLEKLCCILFVGEVGQLCNCVMCHFTTPCAVCCAVLHAVFFRSDAFHQVALAGIEKKAELQGLDRSVFERAPAPAMHALLQHWEQVSRRVCGTIQAKHWRVLVQKLLGDGGGGATWGAQIEDWAVFC